jgi:streptogramin lyase
LSTNVAEFPIRVEGVASRAGSDKNIWFTLSSNNIGMINPKDTAAGVTQYPIPTDNSGDGPIAAGPDGNHWFFEQTADQFGFINPSTGLITEIPLLSISNPDVAGITAGPNGYVWFTAYNTSQIGEINTANDQVTLFPTITPGAEPYGIVEGPDGNMWFTEAGTNQIGMISPTTRAMQEFPIDSSGNDEAERITIGPDHNLWSGRRHKRVDFAYGHKQRVRHDPDIAAFGSGRRQPGPGRPIRRDDHLRKPGYCRVSGHGHHHRRRSIRQRGGER